MGNHTTLFVYGLHPDSSSECLAKLFRGYGPLVRCDIPSPRGASKPKKLYAFVEFQDSRDAEEALYNLRGQMFEGSYLDIQWARSPDASDRRMDRYDRYEHSDRRHERSSSHRRSRSDYDRYERSSNYRGSGVSHREHRDYDHGYRDQGKDRANERRDRGSRRSDAHSRERSPNRSRYNSYRRSSNYTNDHDDGHDENEHSPRNQEKDSSGSWLNNKPENDRKEDNRYEDDDSDRPVRKTESDPTNNGQTQNLETENGLISENYEIIQNDTNNKKDIPSNDTQKSLDTSINMI